jgi:hypothetical protein
MQAESRQNRTADGSNYMAVSHETRLSEMMEEGFVENSINKSAVTKTYTP